MGYLHIKRFRTDAEYRTLVLTAISGIFLLISWFGWLEGLLPFDAAWVSILISGVPILKLAVTGLVTRFDVRAGVLVSIALVASVAIGEYFAAGEVAFIMMIGEVLENRTVRKAQEGMKKLVQLAPRFARLRTQEGEKEIPVEQVRVGDILLVKPGEAIPVDGRIIGGQSSVNQSVITGESMPVDKSAGDEVFVGTINLLGAIEVKAAKVGEDTSLSRLIRLVRESEKKKAPVVRVADQWATRMVPVALAISILVFLATKDMIRAVTILVVFCPCALVLAAPTAVVAGIGNASRRGILIKSGEALEKAARIDTVAFDKTGTITCGKPEVTEVISLDPGYTEDRVLQTAAAAEKFSEHPIGKAVFHKAAEKALAVGDPEEFNLVLGQGVIATVDSRKIIVGNRKLLLAENLQIPEETEVLLDSFEKNGRTVMAVAESGGIIGLITIADKIKPDAKHTVTRLRKLGIGGILMLTGDNEKTAQSIARDAGIEKVCAEQLPEGKVKVIEQLIRENKKVCMVGDGVNDAPALAVSNVGVAMGALGADVAVETADIALMSDDIAKIPELIVLSRKVMGTITANILISMGINLGAILLAAAGILNPVAGALVHNFGSVLVVANSATLIAFRIQWKENG